MSGTSLDAIDAALVCLTRDQPPKLIHALNHTIPDAIRTSIEQLCHPGHDEINRLGKLDIQLGRLFADAALALLDACDTKPHNICAIGSHGQTIRHHPEREYPFTLQIGDPNTIAFHTGITTVADFRRMDMAAGGQGAPLVPAFHEAVLCDATETRAIINIGGMANVTVLDNQTPTYGFDTGPGNILMDGWIQQQLQQSFDAGGDWARTGSVDTSLLDQLLSHPYILLAPPKSTGRESFHPAWLAAELGEFHHLVPCNVQRTLLEFTAQSIAKSVDAAVPHVDRALLCGGGSHNSLLRERLQALLPHIHIGTTTEFGIDADWLEAMAFAWLAQQKLAGMAGNAPAATGARQLCILGGVYSPSHGERRSATTSC
jgi:anhydro-N-acetylmuramic acid kinase